MRLQNEIRSSWLHLITDLSLSIEIITDKNRRRGLNIREGIIIAMRLKNLEVILEVILIIGLIVDKTRRLIDWKLIICEWILELSIVHPTWVIILKL